MGHWLGAFYESRAGTAALTNVAALADAILRASGDNITIPPSFNQLMAAYAAASIATAGVLNGAQLQAPSMRKIGSGTYKSLSRYEVLAAAAVLEPTDPTPIEVFNPPVPLDSGEDLTAHESASTTNTAKSLLAFWLGDGNYVNPYPNIPIDTIKLTGTTTLTANAWSSVALTLDQNLASGRYAILGMRAIAAGAHLARIVSNVPGYINRPGCIAYDVEDDIENSMFRNGNMGVWTEFNSNAIPQVEFLSDSADTAETVYWDVVRIGDLLK